MLINEKPNSPTNDDGMFLDGVTSINSGQWLLAYGIFKELTANAKNPNGASLFNMAICYFHAEEYVKTIEILSDALQTMSKPSSLSNQFSNIPQPLLAVEYKTDAHFFAFTETTFRINPAIVKLRIRRLLVDVNLKMENWQEVIRLSTFPEMEKCKNVIEAVGIAKRNMSL